MQEVVGEAKGKGKGKKGYRPPDVRRGGWFAKAQTLCEMVLMDSPQARAFAEDIYAGPGQH